MANNPYEQGGDNPFTRKAMAQPIPAMTLRDWFAGQALAGLLAPYGCVGSVNELAKTSYRVADAMLAERGK